MIFEYKNRIDDVFTYPESYNVILDEFGGRVDFVEFRFVKSIDFTGFIDDFRCNFEMHLILLFKLKF